jgi:hypothetical protein
MAALISTSVLIPVLDNDGLPFPVSLTNEFRRRLLAVQAHDPDGVGYSTRAVRGVWIQAGRSYEDESLEYSVGFDSWRTVDDWLDVVKWARAAYRQEALFITILGISEAWGA